MARSRPWRLFGGDASARPAREPSVSTSTEIESIAKISQGREPTRDAQAGPTAASAFVDFAEPVLVIEPGGTLIAANGAAMELASRHDLSLGEGQAIETFLGPLCLANAGDAEPWTPLDGNAWMDGLADLAETRRGEAIYELKTTSRRDREGRVVDVIVRLADVTAFAEALRGRKAAEGHRDRFLKLLSHDMRSPLAAILATLKHPDLAALPAAPREIIESSSSRALAMIDATVRLTRAQCADYRFVELDFCHVVEEAIDACWAKAKSARVKIVLAPCDEPFPILADRGYLTEGLIELFNAAIDVYAEGSELICRFTSIVLKGHPAALLEVGDESNIEAVSRSAVKAIDTGAGLDLLRTVVARHGGVVTGELEPINSGVVCLTIPSVQLATGG